MKRCAEPFLDSGWGVSISVVVTLRVTVVHHAERDGYTTRSMTSLEGL